MAVSFKNDVLPLFTQTDIDHMSQQDPAVLLDDYSYMSDATGNYANANAVLDQVRQHLMPPSWSNEQPWTDEMVDTFEQWMADGYQP
jgi:hypothetical protein